MTNHPRMGCAFVEGFKPEILAPDVSLAATPAVEDLRNALTIAQTWSVVPTEGTSVELLDRIFALEAVARLLRQALTKLEQGAK